MTNILQRSMLMVFMFSHDDVQLSSDANVKPAVRQVGNTATLFWFTSLNGAAGFFRCSNDSDESMP